MLKLLHTADWHLGRSFRSFTEEASTKLARARLAVLDRIFLEAERQQVDAVLCAGDLFDGPRPADEWWEQVASKLKQRNWKNRPVFLLPGNHDPLTDDSIWKDNKFRRLLPDWVHVVDREDFEFVLPNNAVLYAVPCLSKAGQLDPTMKIPKRAEGDNRIRIGMVHGSTFDAKDCQTNFPIAVDAAVLRGLNYLAIGDTHGFRFVPPDRLTPPTIYPGAPEPTAFDEKDPGCVAVVLITGQGRARVEPKRVAVWTWEEHTITTLEALKSLATRGDLGERVLRLTLDMMLAAPDYEAAESILEGFIGTSACHPKVGVLDLHREGLQLDTSNVDTFCSDLPEVLRSAVTRLKLDAADPLKRAVAERALFHLYRLTRKRVA